MKIRNVAQIVMSVGLLVCGTLACKYEFHGDCDEVCKDDESDWMCQKCREDEEQDKAAQDDDDSCGCSRCSCTNCGCNGSSNCTQDDCRCDDPALRDSDNDGIKDVDEAELGTDPNKADTDGDGFEDGAEVGRGTNPLDPDTDADGETDKEEVDCKSSPLDPYMKCADVPVCPPEAP